jgi:hypothetical protein
VLRPLKFNEPGSLTTCAPLNSFACHTQNVAPSGSAKTAVRPTSMTSNGSFTTLPPASRALAAVSSALSTETYVSHVAVDGADSAVDPTAATAPPCRPAMKYLPSDSGGITFSNVQPKRPL